MMIIRSKSQAPRPPGSAADRTAGARLTRILSILLIVGAAGHSLPFEASERRTVDVSGEVLLRDESDPKGIVIELQRVLPAFEQLSQLLTDASVSSTTARVVTDRDGSFQLRVPEPGIWKVVARANGLVPMETPPLPVTDSLTLPPVALDRDVGLKVTLHSPSGLPIRGARIQARAAFEQPELSAEAWRPHRPSRRTDSAGHARLRRREGEQVSFSVSKRGYRSAYRRADSPVQMVLEVSQGNRAEVKTVWSDDSDAGGVLLIDEMLDWPIALTSSEGLALVSLPDSGEIRISALTLGGAAQAFTINAGSRSEPSDPIPLVLDSPDELSGQVVGAEARESIPMALVWREDDPGRWIFTGESGMFKVILPPDRNPRILAQAAGYFRLAVAAKRFTTSTAKRPILALEPATHTVGRVVDELGKAIAGARISAEPTDLEMRRKRLRRKPSSHETRSRGDGSFDLPYLLPDTPYRLHALAPGYAPIYHEFGTSAHGKRSRPLELILEQGHQAVGRVLDQDGSPVENAAVSLLPPSRSDLRLKAAYQSQRSTETSISTTTDSKGSFRFFDLGPRTFDLVVSSERHSPETRAGIEILPGDPVTDIGLITIENGVLLTGRVLDSEGRPVAGVRVRIVVPFETPGGGGGQFASARPGDTTFSDREGVFRIDSLNGDSAVDLSLERKGFVPRLVSKLIPGGSSPIEISLTPASSVAGRIVDSSGRPVTRASVTILPEGLRQSLTQHIAARGSSDSIQRTDSAGRFSFDDLDPGRIRISVRARGFSPKTLRGIVVDPESPVENLEIAIEAGLSVSGTVFDSNGKPLSETKVLIRGDSDITDSFGMYHLNGIQPGSHRIVARHEDLGQTERELHLEEDARELDLVFSGGQTIRGKVVATSGESIQGAEVALQPLASGPGERRVFSGHEGEFEIRSVQPGSYLLRGRKRGFVSARTESEVEVGASTPVDAVIELAPGATIRGTILGLAERELGRAMIAASQPGSRTRPGRVDAEGGFTITDLAAGEWLVEARLSGSSLRAQGRVSLAPGKPEEFLELEIGTGLTLAGRAFENGSPLAGATVSIATAEGQVVGSGIIDHQGGFQLEGLEKGSYVFSLRSRDGSLQGRRALRLDQDIELDLDLRTSGISGFCLDARTGEPLEDAAMHLQALPTGTEELTAASQRAFSLPGGQFELSRVLPGRYRLRAEKEGFEATAREMTIAPETTLENLTFTLSRGP